MAIEEPLTGRTNREASDLSKASLSIEMPGTCSLLT
jgi:hypothetical protein